MSNKKTNFAKSNEKNNHLNLITYMENINNNYDFIFDKDYIEPILIPLEDIKGLDIYDNL